MNLNNIRQGDIYLIRLPESNDRSVIGSRRPCVVVTNNYALNMGVLSVTVVPCTTKDHYPSLETHIPLFYPLERPSMAICQQITTVPISSLGRKIGSLSERDLIGVKKGIMLTVGCL